MSYSFTAHITVHAWRMSQMGSTPTAMTMESGVSPMVTHRVRKWLSGTGGTTTNITLGQISAMMQMAMSAPSTLIISHPSKGREKGRERREKGGRRWKLYVLWWVNGGLDDCCPKGLRRCGVTPSGQLRGKIKLFFTYLKIHWQFNFVSLSTLFCFSQGITHWALLQFHDIVFARACLGCNFNFHDDSQKKRRRNCAPFYLTCCMDMVIVILGFLDGQKKAKIFLSPLVIVRGIKAKGIKSGMKAPRFNVPFAFRAHRLCVHSYCLLMEATFTYIVTLPLEKMVGQSSLLFGSGSHLFFSFTVAFRNTRHR